MQNGKKQNRQATITKKVNNRFLQHKNKVKVVTHIVLKKLANSSFSVNEKFAKQAVHDRSNRKNTEFQYKVAWIGFRATFQSRVFAKVKFSMEISIAFVRS